MIDVAGIFITYKFTATSTTAGGGGGGGGSRRTTGWKPPHTVYQIRAKQTKTTINITTTNFSSKNITNGGGVGDVDTACDGGPITRSINITITMSTTTIAIDIDIIIKITRAIYFTIDIINNTITRPHCGSIWLSVARKYEGKGTETGTDTATFIDIILGNVVPRAPSPPPLIPPHLQSL